MNQAVILPDRQIKKDVLKKKTDFRLSEAFKTRKRLSSVNSIFTLFKLVFFSEDKI